ncbi:MULTISPECIES: alpha/beta hydrolase [unclassified Actinomyces]|uniref:alpha/beta hydrolase n=1 Tax=unclassified Actinomyces TaxID=2609248 RepID=UPI000D590263|nr:MULTISPECIES: alpha/beta hydrolase [unclassified Actinomyces]RAX22959.1 alpha/beta hydrolase [Actinomyces sp. Z3]RAX24610.1 alpha/beta hydrolase [Actinomyces sp. Z5]
MSTWRRSVTAEAWFDERLNPDYADALTAFEEGMPDNYLDLDAASRRAIQERSPVPEPDWVARYVNWHEVFVPVEGTDRQVRVRVYTPRTGEHMRPCVLCIHGGGMWAGTLDSEHHVFARIAAIQDAVCVSVDYRLAPEHPFPAGLDDVMVALRWAASCEDLGADRSRIALYGGSAGGGIALGAALRARDEGGPALCFVQAIYPMVDPWSDTPSAYQLVRSGCGTWNRDNNIEGWRWYLAGQPPTIYSAPGTASVEELRGLPPVYMDVGELDLFRDENLVLAARLCAAGVSTELHLTPGLFHGAENVVPEASASRRLLSSREAAMRRHIHPELRPQW